MDGDEARSIGASVSEWWRWASPSACWLRARGHHQASTAAPPPATNQVQDDGQPVAGGKLVMAVTAETNGWNPATSQWAEAGNFVGSSVLEPLMYFDEKGSVQPWLADSVTAETPGDFTKWMIKVKPNIPLPQRSAPRRGRR